MKLNFSNYPQHIPIYFCNDDEDDSVSADYDADSDTVFIAERANGGGRVLAFEDTSAGGNLFPRVSIELSGASSVYFNSQD